jgi:glutathione S-transferase
VPAPALLPIGAKARARARLLEDDADWLMNGPIVDLLAETYRKPDPATRDEKKIAACADLITEAYGRLEGALADGRAHLCGESFTLSDVSWLLPVSFAAFFGVPPGEGQPFLGAWLARVAARPSVAAESKAMREALAKLPN